MTQSVELRQTNRTVTIFRTVFVLHYIQKYRSRRPTMLGASSGYEDRILDDLGDTFKPCVSRGN